MNDQEIVVATDFSEVGDNAVHFACAMGSHFNLPITIVHSYVVPVTFSETPLPIISLDETRNIAVENLKELAEKIAQAYPQVELHAKVLYGEVTDALLDYEKEHQPAFIVVGNSGSGNSSFWMGSNVSSMMRELQSTVIAVPTGLRFHPPRNISFACDLQKVKEHLPKHKLKYLLDRTNASLHILHIEDVSRKYDDEQIATIQFLREQFPLAQFDTITSDRVDSAITEYVSKNQVDWVLLMPKKHSFLYNLFHTTHTEGLLKIDNLPIVALHH